MPFYNWAEMRILVEKNVSHPASPLATPRQAEEISRCYKMCCGKEKGALKNFCFFQFLAKSGCVFD